MGLDSQNLSDLIPKALKGEFGIRFGPGVLPIVGTVAAVGAVMAGFAAWALHEYPYAAVTTAIVILLLAVYFVERATRYSERNPLPALMSGAQLLKVYEHQMGAANKAIVSESDIPQVGGARTGLTVIEPDGERR
jgi:hypothetical protein